MEKAEIKYGNFFGERSIEISSRGYAATIIPARGANVVRLLDLRFGASIVRTPENADDFINKKMFFGIPFLFPPNRIAGGRFKTAIREYSMPLISNDGKHYIHGIIRHKKWKIDDMYTEDGCATVTMSLYMDEKEEMYPYFPHIFSISVKYILSDKGLHQIVKIENCGIESMPVGFGQHTTINIPFTQGSREEDYLLRLPVTEKWILDGDMLPTGQRIPLCGEEIAFYGNGLPPLAKTYSTTLFPIDTKFFGDRMHQIEVLDTASGHRLIYELDSGYTHLVLWNDGGNKKYVCVEPMTWMINAPNIELPDSDTGYREIAPGEKWEIASKLHMETRLNVVNK